ncbi:MAG: DUF3089 domain-containing protein [Sinimarinibacterium sp.]
MIGWLLLGGGIAVLLYLLATRWLEDIFLFFVTPRHEPGTRPAPRPPDYADPAAWAAWPGTNGPAERVPSGETRVPEAERPADVFYIHPTLWMSPHSWNGPIDDPVLNRRVDSMLITGQAAAFNKAGRIFAPRYRQCTVVATRLHSRHVPAIDLAYQDIKRAFQHFLAHGTDGRPLILAAHSQGSFHLLRLLAEDVLGTPLMRRLVAVYAPGCWTPKDLFAPGGVLAGLPVCEGPLDTGCFIAWETFAEDGDPLAMQLKVPYWDGTEYRGREPEALDAVIIDPISWQRSGGSPRDAHLGLVRTGYRSYREASRLGGLHGDAPLPAPTRRHISTRLARNAVRVSRITDPKLKYAAFKGKSLHVLDYTLFFLDVRENAYARATSFRAAGADTTCLRGEEAQRTA